MCLCDTPMGVLILGIACLICNLVALAVLYSVFEERALFEFQVYYRGVTAFRVVTGVYYVLGCLLSVALIIATRLSNRGLLEKVLLGIKIKVVFFILIQSLVIYTIATSEPEIIVIANIDIPKRSRIENDSSSLDLGTIANLDPGAIADPKLLAVNTKSPEQERVDKPKFDFADWKKNRIMEKVALLVIWTPVDVFVIYRLGIFISTVRAPPT
ncbi:uncharacterized protein [Dermacentor albipictus]|uniref:uncharacterized protein isoform X3 n=1 Tax=Dermacentor albipictus TaxID=60249 RepID=UPI0038FD21E3